MFVIRTVRETPIFYGISRDCNSTMGLNSDEREILERLFDTPGNSAEFCANDFSFGLVRFCRALDKLLHMHYIDSIAYSPDSINEHIFGMQFTFKDIITDNSTKVEIIKTDDGKRYLKDHPSIEGLR